MLKKERNYLKVDNIQQRITYLQDKLSDMRIRYAKGSPAMKAWILQGAKLFKEEKRKLIEKEQKQQEKLF